MAVSVTVLGSGSRGNAIYVSDGASSILVDAGFSARDIDRRMRSRGLDPARLNAVLIESSTLSIAWVRELAARAAQHGNAFLDAPVTGSKLAAETGTLTLLVGGDADVLAKARPVLAAFSSNIVHFGPDSSGALYKLINNLQAAGILVEVSAGNEGSGCSTLRSPGDYWEVLTTGSINHAAAYPGTMTGFSSRGPSALDPGSYFPDITAPGENIRSSVPGGGYEGGWSGTSMAGPHATALIGLIWSANPALRGQVEQTIQIIHDTATPVTSYVGSCGGNYVTGPNNDWGYGTIDALATVQLVMDAISTLPWRNCASNRGNADSGSIWGASGAKASGTVMTVPSTFRCEVISRTVS